MSIDLSRYTNTASPYQEQMSSIVSDMGSFMKDMREESSRYNTQYADILQRLMDREDSAGTGNPFIDMLDGYIRMKKRRNPEYEWRGLVTTIPEAIGGLLGRSRPVRSLPYTETEMPKVEFERTAIQNPIRNEQPMINGRRR